MPPLGEQQWELDGVVFGLGTGIEVRDFDLGAPDIETGDVTLPGRDGVVFGRDTHGARTLVWELFTARSWDATAARALWAELARAWGNPARAQPRAVIPLRMRLPGGETVVAYGRPRRFAADPEMARQGHVEAQAEFVAADSGFYADGDGGAERSITLTLVAAAGSGIVWPVTWPIVWGAQGERQDAVTNFGDAATWPVITFHGPVAQPSVEIVATGARFRLDATLAHDQSVAVDTRPWARTVTRSDGASLAGALRGSPLSEFRLPIGQTVLAYRGTDLSGQSRCVISWRDAYTTP